MYRLTATATDSMKPPLQTPAVITVHEEAKAKQQRERILQGVVDLAEVKRTPELSGGGRLCHEPHGL
ncbi:hypothetical protein, partial [Acidovorax sp.]|uniref:hypothetical protein n=1 Tax=Acidovorax sp. TaxID=1872122 RepID=UPI003919448F